jgi:hypothetical protein
LSSSVDDEQLMQLVEGICRILAPRFAQYEKAAGLEHPSDAFRIGLALAVTKLLVSRNAPDIPQKRRELERRTRAAARRVDEVRAAARQWAEAPELRNAVSREYDRAFVEWFALQLQKDELCNSPKRGPRRKEAADIFVQSIGIVYTATTGRDWTSVTNLGEHTGPFADLLRTIEADIRTLIPRLSPHLRKSWPASLTGRAKRLRLRGNSYNC